MDKEGIKGILPHREPMLLLDSVERNGDEAHGSYTVKGDEFFLQGHFPGFSVVPGVILCEILAQSACVLMDGAIAEGMLPLYAGIDKARFRRPVRPGDEFRTVCRIMKSRGPFRFAEGKGYVGGELAVEASFSFAVAEKDSICSPRS